MGNYYVFKTTDGGESWIDFGGGRALALDPARPSTVYAGSGKSTDGGATWQSCGGGGEVLAFDPDRTSTIYAGSYESGVVKSTDGCKTFGPVNNGFANLNVRSLMVAPDTAGTIYAGTDDSVFKSTEGGASWLAISTWLSDREAYALAVNSRFGSVVHAGTFGGGVFRSENAGSTWTQVNNGLAAEEDFRELAHRR